VEKLSKEKIHLEQQIRFLNFTIHSLVFRETQNIISSLQSQLASSKQELENSKQELNSAKQEVTNI
jgi:hypothetical protein